MSGILFTNPRFTPVNNAGTPRAGAVLYFYQAGTSTLANVYTTSDLSTPHTSPVEADAAGVFPAIYLDPSAGYDYKAICKTSATGSQVWSEDNIPATSTFRHPRTSAEIAAGVTPTDYSYEPGDVRRYGATGDGTTDDTTAIQAALDQLESDGANVVFEPKTYNLGSRSGGVTVLTLASATGGVIHGNGAVLKVTTTDTSAPVILKIQDCSHLSVYGLRGNDPGYAQATQSGAVLFDICATAATDEDIGHMRFVGCQLNQGVLFARVRGDVAGQSSTNQTNRIRDLTFDSCSVKASFYCLNFQNHGDDVVIEDFSAEDVHRTYFAYGVVGHRGAVHIKNPRGGYAQVLIKAYDRSTENIRLRAYFETSASGYECATLEFQNDTQDESIRDIELDLNCRNAVATADPVTFRAYDNADPIGTRTTTDNIWDNIRITGDWTGFLTPITFTTRPNTKGRLILSESLVKSLPVTFNHSGFILITDPLTEIHCVNGDLTANSITIPLSRYDGAAFAIKCRVYAQDNLTNVASAAISVSEDLLLAYNSAGGNVGILTNTNLLTATNGTASAISYSESGENIVVAFTAYSNANAFARVIVEHLKGFPG